MRRCIMGQRSVARLRMRVAHRRVVVGIVMAWRTLLGSMHVSEWVQTNLPVLISVTEVQHGVISRLAFCGVFSNISYSSQPANHRHGNNRHVG
ncbi:hypothetical protein EDD22DRAFT_895508 [Suillus occidentalis]|nr:hypothetical protein EDD22DRAFT_895508 [Suillus occidentalis]